MAYDELFADRVREVLRNETNIQEKKMFGGLGFMLNGHLAVAVSKNGLIVRFDRSQQTAIMAHPDAQPFAPTGKIMQGWALVDVFDRDVDVLADWVHRSCAYAASLPPKS